VGDDAKRTRDDLIQVEYELYSDMLEERRTARESKFEYWSARCLGVGPREQARVGRTYVPPLAEALAVAIGSHVRRSASEVRGANADGAPTWKRGAAGDSNDSADWLSAHFPAGSLSEAPLIIQWWERHGERNLQVTVRKEDEERAHVCIATLEADARGALNPWRGKLLEAKHGGRGIMFDVRNPEDLDPGPLWFPDEIWKRFSDNVIDALPQLTRLQDAGLGSNRGVLLVGPPGTGKTALCRLAAQKLNGIATVVLCSAQVGQWSLSHLYEEVGFMSPAVVFLEDLDLLVGDREDGSERNTLIEFLTVLEGLMTRHQQVISVASSNDANAIDAAAMRAGRFDVVIELGPPEAEGRRAILRNYLERIPGNVDADAVADATDGFTGADLREVLRRAVLAARSEDVTTELVLGAVEAQRFVPDRKAKGSTAPVGRYL
jgi:hypothetical protein